MTGWTKKVDTSNLYRNILYRRSRNKEFLTILNTQEETDVVIGIRPPFKEEDKYDEILETSEPGNHSDGLTVAKLSKSDSKLAARFQRTPAGLNKLTQFLELFASHQNMPDSIVQDINQELSLSVRKKKSSSLKET